MRQREKHICRGPPSLYPNRLIESQEAGGSKEQQFHCTSSLWTGTGPSTGVLDVGSSSLSEGLLVHLTLILGFLTGKGGGGEKKQVAWVSSEDTMT